MSKDSSLADDEKLWLDTAADLNALKCIIYNHFQSTCCDETSMEHRSYARVFLYTLESGQKVIARIVLPVRERFKTEAEVASMNYVRGW